MYNSGVIENVFFRAFGRYVFGTLGNEANIIIHIFSPLSPFNWPQNTWPWMTLNGLKGNFTLYLHYYERPLTDYLLLIYCSLLITHVTGWPMHVTSGEVRELEYQIVIRRIFGIRGKSADLPWTLYRRNANIIIIVLLSALSPFHWLQNTWL